MFAPREARKEGSTTTEAERARGGRRGTRTRATIEHHRSQSDGATVREGSGAKRLSGEVGCCSNGRRETGGIKLLQTITFNEKVNATSRGLARTWMQMCRRRVISKQSSPPTRHLLLSSSSSSTSSPPPFPTPPSHCRHLLLCTTAKETEKRSGPRSYTTFVRYIPVYVRMKYICRESASCHTVRRDTFRRQ